MELCETCRDSRSPVEDNSGQKAQFSESPRRNGQLLLLLLSRFSRVRLCATPWTAGSSVHRILQARTLEWVAFALSEWPPGNSRLLDSSPS